MKILKIRKHKIQLDNEDYYKFKNSNIYIEKSRNKFIIRIKLPLSKRIVFPRLILNEPSRRIGYKDNNEFNLQKNNLFIKDAEYKQTKYTLYNTEYQKRYNKKNKKLRIIYSRNYYRKNKKECLKRTTKYNKSEKGIITRRKSLRTPKNKYRRAKYDIMREGKAFHISKKQYIAIITKPCHYCCKNLEDEYGRNLDRINNNKGYYVDNVLSCCGNCNKTRSNLYTVEETKVMITALIEYRKIQKIGKDDDLIDLNKDKKDE